MDEKTITISTNLDLDVWGALVKAMTDITDETEVIEQLKTDIKSFREYIEEYGIIYYQPSIVDLFINQYRYTLKAFHHGCYDKYSTIFDKWLIRTNIIQYRVSALNFRDEITKKYDFSKCNDNKKEDKNE